jgi:hypothetical protein
MATATRKRSTSKPDVSDEGKVPARAEVDQSLENSEQEHTERQETAAETAERTQAAQLKQSLPGGDRGDLEVPEQRSGPGARPIDGRVDNMTRRSDADALQGHMCYIDYSEKGVVDLVKGQLAPEGSPLDEQGFDPGLGVADRGVFTGVASVGEDGYPETVIVMLRDEYAPAQVVVPYSALRQMPRGAGGPR